MHSYMKITEFKIEVFFKAKFQFIYLFLTREKNFYLKWIKN